MSRTATHARKEKSLSPLQLGYQMAAEWEPHEATWLAWPHNEETWPGKLDRVEEIYLQMIEVLTPHEKIHLLVNDAEEREKVEKKLAKRGIASKHILYFLIPTVDAWVRDYGPCFIKKRISPHPSLSPKGGEGDMVERRLAAWSSRPERSAWGGGEGGIAFVKWVFNAWGGKYESLALDNAVGNRLVPLLEMPVFFPELVLEGGSIDTNGKGTVLVTEQCLLNPNRNPHLSRSGIEEALRNFLGLTHFIWLGEGIEGDDTDGHIDDITRFADPTTVVTAIERNTADPNQVPLRKNLERLKQATDEKGKKLNLATVPMPDRVEGSGGRLPASYLNFYIANGVVLVPIFGQAKDEVALGILRELFPKRRVVGIRSEDLVGGLGGIHCVTHEEPACS